jgi:hypothetical protein
MADIIDERRMARIINDAASYRHIRQIILNNDRTEHEPTTSESNAVVSPPLSLINQPRS